MKYVMGILCLIVAGVCCFKPKLLSDTNMIFGSVFICLSNLFFNSKRNND